MKSRVLAVIPARGGSKRVPRKNIREVGGKPLIAYTIEQAEKSSVIDRSVVSTEDQEIKSVARNHGGDVPFDRPERLATDTATSDEVVQHAVDWFSDQDEEFDIVCLLPVTTPFRDPSDITNCVRKLIESDADSVIGLTEFDLPPFWAVENTEEYLEPYFEGVNVWEKTQTQETPDLHHPNGALFAASIPKFLEKGSFYTDRTIGYDMPRSRSLDIDEPFDLELARALMEYRS